MSKSKVAFSKNKHTFLFDFSAAPLTSDAGSLVVAKKIKELKIDSYFAPHIRDGRDQRYCKNSTQDLLFLKLLLLCCGYEDCNDVHHLRNDPAFVSLFNKKLPSQSTLSRWENSLNISGVIRLAYKMIDYYVSTIDPKRKQIVIDVDCSADPTFGNQQGSLFHGFHWMFMYNQLFYIDGETGQVILPVLRPGNVHTSKWSDYFLKIVVNKIRERFPQMKIILRADAGYSGPALYKAIEELDIEFAVGISANERLKSMTKDQVDFVSETYVKCNEKHQEFAGPFDYKAESWETPQKVYAKVESTGKGLNVRYFVSNFRDQNAEEIYRGFYVLRGEAAENRIKDIKNFCYSGRLSCHRFSANYFRLIMSCLAYEILRSVRAQLSKITKDPAIRAWSVQSIRLKLLKVAASVEQTVRRTYFRMAKGHPYADIITELLI